jgi:hypothetical protein
MVVGKPVVAVITSSPGFRARSPCMCEVRPVRAVKLADEPELTVSTPFFITPRYWPSRCSNAALKRPVVSQKSRAESTKAGHFRRAVHLAGDRNGGLARDEGLRPVGEGGVLSREIENLAAQFLGFMKVGQRALSVGAVAA